MGLKASCSFIWCYFLFILIYSCQHSVHVEYTDTFTIKFSEGYIVENQSSNPEIFLCIRTDSSYGTICALKSYFEVESDTILVKIFGIDQSRSIHLGVEGPHYEFYKLNLQNHQYKLIIEYQDKLDEYNININSKCIEIESRYNLYTNPEYLTYWRYPEKSFMYHYTSANEIEDEFLKKLSTVIKIEEIKFPVYGKICYPNWESSGYISSFKYYYYEDESDFEKAGSILQSYLNDSSSTSVYKRIYLVNWQNLSFDKYF